MLDCVEPGGMVLFKLAIRSQLIAIFPLLKSDVVKLGASLDGKGIASAATQAEHYGLD
jgi:hypothetical protein